MSINNVNILHASDPWQYTIPYTPNYHVPDSHIEIYVCLTCSLRESTPRLHKKGMMSDQMFGA